jgi:hypothetical protein
MMRNQRYPGKLCRLLLYLTLILSFVCLSACKTTDDAASAAKQLSIVATRLDAYYDDLSKQLDDTVRLNELLQVMDGIPFGDADRARILVAKAEIHKRAGMAHSLADLASAYSNLSSSTAKADASTSASDLATALDTAKAIPDGSAIPDIAGQAAKLLVNFVQVRDVKSGSAGVSKGVAAVSEIFDGEVKAYESIQKQRLALAALISKKLVDNHGVDVDFGELVEPATKPFALNPKGQDVSSDPKYVQLLDDEIGYQVRDQERQFVDTTKDLAASLHSVRDAIERVAGTK